MDKKLADVILISDIHLGADYCHAEELIEMLDTWEFKKLILVGDVFQHGDFDRLHKMDRLHRNHWKVLSYFRQLTDPQNAVEVIWIEGNHDWKVLDIIGALLGLRIFDEYIWESGGKRYIAIHGHQFDKRLPKGEIITRFGQNVYLLFQRYLGYSFTRFVSKMSKQFSRSADSVREGAISYAHHKDCDVVFCGHTHLAETVSKNIDSRTFQYFNCGTWADGDHLSYITIIGNDISINIYPFKIDPAKRPRPGKKPRRAKSPKPPKKPRAEKLKIKKKFLRIGFS